MGFTIGVLEYSMTDEDRLATIDAFTKGARGVPLCQPQDPPATRSEASSFLTGPQARDENHGYRIPHILPLVAPSLADHRRGRKNLKNPFSG